MIPPEIAFPVVSFIRSFLGPKTLTGRELGLELTKFDENLRTDLQICSSCSWKLLEALIILILEFLNRKRDFWTENVISGPKTCFFAKKRVFSKISPIKRTGKHANNLGMILAWSRHDLGMI